MNNKIKKLKAEIEEIKKQCGGKFGRQDMVDYARKHKDSELHPCFEWDDRIAGEKYRLEQAGHIIRSLKITIVERETEVVRIREYSSLTTERNGDGSYRSTIQILSDDEMKAQLGEDLRRELVSINIRLRAFSLAASKLVDRSVSVVNSEIKKLRPATAQARRG
jgi:hypothetical protein